MIPQSLTQLLAIYLPANELSKLADLHINAMTLDSREVTIGSLFVALKGSVTDGRQYIDSALAAGATAILSELTGGENSAQANFVEVTPQGTIIHLADLPAKLSALAGEFYQQPSQKVTMIAVTGTNGKTTVTHLIAQWLELLGHQTYTLGTLGNGLLAQLVPSPNTTLNAIDLQKHLAQAVALNASHVVMEVSSHGLALHRVADIQFDVAVFTNLSRDHLDFHGDMVSYAAAKQSLFSAKHCKRAVLNGDDPISSQWLANWDSHVNVSCFSRQDSVHAFIAANETIYHSNGIETTIKNQQQALQLKSKLLGAFNLENILAALTALTSAGFDLAELVGFAPQLKPVAGRMEAFVSAGKPTVVVDYAHTSDALAKALQALRVHCSGQLIVMFGCGGDRDQGKRPLMAAAAEQYADQIIFTQDNSRSEDPKVIIEQMLTGLNNRSAIKIELERTKAVELAINHANEQDIVLLAGKGHEDYQIIGQQRINYDERAWARDVLEKGKPL
ncbi:MAG: UDP-N-acetylmuramoyl-L-alanyl-D-glutamate--2,6-diaminopimelate ligase [Gammaproteobacteria bacterium]|nr:UDP-N-acetylmuramoyl-L-alanyl-D-glutamate--2,6-diaminopimelate ligase [Gammaproteobacteria bacterium]